MVEKVTEVEKFFEKLQDDADAAAANRQPEPEQSTVSATNLSEPTSNIDWLNQNTDDIHNFGVFSTDTAQNAIHYDNFAAKYDGMQDNSGFNDPFELTKALVQKLAQPG